ncbi:peptidoglycan-associated lipoprotein Pal [Halocynthiibacter namhaensis]|uniref:peptidoglycan-associated lipoprotein Pal n=1 Tax=Halocynthiibacter namhaensis TaxID=1290553 RepID=UPI0005795250|nr:peptidoglycan-associated lipoprotein Pal [Halocynthiibacter namhaensis]
MNMKKTAALLLVAGALSACSNADRFGNGGNGGTNGAGNGGIVAGSVNDPHSVAYFQQTVGDRVLFLVNQSTLTDQGRSVLAGQAQWLSQNPEYTARVEGHADEQGTREYNLALGARRANAVSEYLVSQGVSSARVNTVSFGKERPIEICSSESCYSQNRRSVTVVGAGIPTS